MRMLIFILPICFFITGEQATAEDGQGLRLLTEDLSPFAYYERGSLKGVSVELVEAIERRLGITASITVLPWARALSEATGTGNTALFTTARTPERETLFQWVGPIAVARTSFFRYRNSTIQVPSVSAAKDKLVVVTRGYPEQALLVKLGFSQIYDCNDAETPWRLVAAGRGDLAVSGEISAVNNWIEAGFARNDFERVGPPLFESGLYIAFSKNAPPEEVEHWRRAWLEIKGDGTWEGILRKAHLTSILPD